MHDGRWSDGPFTFRGEHSTVENLDARPKPVRRPHPPLIIVRPCGAWLAARFADEYNASFVTPEEVRAQGRHRRGVREDRPRAQPFSMMTQTVVGADETEVPERVRAVETWTGSAPNPDIRAAPFSPSRRR